MTTISWHTEIQSFDVVVIGAFLRICIFICGHYLSK